MSPTRTYITPQVRHVFRKARLPLAAALLLLQACAVPVPPTGGPPDTTPASLVSSTPASGAVSVDTDRLIFEFSEPVDEASFRSAFSITPELDGPIELGGSSRRIEVRLPESLREATTYRVTLDVSLRDQRGVTLSSPITLAFATGPEIDTAFMSGRMLKATDGSAASGIDVLAFASADSSSLAEGPLFRTQTGGDGRFRMDYLPADSYFVVGLQDRNRNRRIDEGEWIAVPPVAAIKADTTDQAIIEPWILMNPDRTAPFVERVRAVSDSELEIRMSEALALILDGPMPTGHSLALSDSSGSRTRPVTDLWFSADRPRTLFARVDNLTPGSWRLNGQLALADSVGNAALDPDLDFIVPEGLPAPDPAELLGWTPDSLDTSPAALELPDEIRTVWPMERPGVRLTRPSSGTSISFSDSTGQDVAVRIEQPDATWYTWDAGPGVPDPYRVSITVPGEDSTRSIWLRMATMRELGALGLIVDRGEFETGSIKGLLYPAVDGGRVMGRAGLDGDMLLFDGLPGGFRGRLMIFVDRDGDGTWSPGSLLPFVPAEPVRWHVFEEPVRPRWDTIAEDSVRFVPSTEADPNE